MSRGNNHSASVRLMGVLALILGTVPAFGAGQSVQITSGVSSVTLPNAAPWTTIGLNSSPMRWELRIHEFGPDWPAYPGYLVNLGPVRLMKGYTTNVVQASSNLDNYFGSVYDNGPLIAGCCSARTDILVRVQRDVANARYTLEVCNATGGGCLSGVTPIISYGPTSWVGKTLGLAGGGKIGFLRWFSSVAPLGTPIPVNGAAGDLGDWELDGNLQDSSGHGLNFSGGSASYSASPVYSPACNPGTQQSLRAGDPAQLDGSGSYPLDGGTFISHVWQLASGPSSGYD